MIPQSICCLLQSVKNLKYMYTSMYTAPGVLSGTIIDNLLSMIVKLKYFIAFYHVVVKLDDKCIQCIHSFNVQGTLNILQKTIYFPFLVVFG